MRSKDILQIVIIVFAMNTIDYQTIWNKQLMIKVKHQNHFQFCNKLINIHPQNKIKYFSIKEEKSFRNSIKLFFHIKALNKDLYNKIFYHSLNIFKFIVYIIEFILNIEKSEYSILLIFTILFFNFKINNFSNKNKGNISFLILIFFVSTFQTYDDTTQTLTITQTSEFTDDYKNITKHVIIKEVEEIKEKAFYEWNELSSAQIGDSVKTILDEAFCSCYNLENIELGSNLEIISNGAFVSCNKLKIIKLGSKLRTISDTAFGLCNSLINITIPKSVITFGNNVFISCENLETVIFEEGLTIIGPLMFQSCNQLKYINIPSSISTIGVNPFNKCENLQFIKVSNENLYFCNYYNDGILYDKNITKLISYPIGNSTRTFHIPISITSIEGYSFELCPYLETIFIGEKVRTIDIYAFRLCSSLQCIYYYGETPPTIPENRFHDPFDKVLATTVMTKETYSSDTFAYLNVTKGTTNDECLPWPTQTFSSSNTYSNIFTQSNTYIQSNTFSNTNSFSQSNTYTQSNSFTNSKSNKISKSNKFTKSNTFTYIDSDLTFTYTYTLTYSLTFTKTLSYYLTFIKSYSITNTESEYRYIYTEIIYYNYTIIIYSTYYEYYSNFYSIYYSNENMNEDNNNDNNELIIIVIVCIIIIILIVITLLVVILKRNQIRKMKQEEEEEYTEEGNTNILSIGIGMSHIEEDPFAKDFKENEFNSQI